MKKIMTVLLALAMVFGISATAFAADAGKEADALHELGLFKGYGDVNGSPVYGLEDEMNRAQGIILLVRMLGKESEALAGSWTHPFADTEAYYDKYVGYAYANKLTNGISGTEFGGNLRTTNKMFATFCLRALGYRDSGNNPEFTWDTAMEKAKSVGLDAGTTETVCKRSSAVDLFWTALNTKINGSGKTMGEKLISDGVFTAESFTSAKKLAEDATTGENDLPDDELTNGDGEGSQTGGNPTTPKDENELPDDDLN